MITRAATGTKEVEGHRVTSNVADQLNGHDAGAVTLRYETSGSQTCSTAAGDVYRWCLHGSMVSIGTNGDGTADIIYTDDSDGMRVSRSANSGTIHYPHDKRNPGRYWYELGQLTKTESYSAAGQSLSTTETVYNADGKVITTKDALGNASHSYYDLAGRPVRSVAADGTSTETLYDSFGRAYFTSDRHVGHRQRRWHPH